MNTKKVPRPRWQVILLKALKYTWLPAACLAAILAGLLIGYVSLGGQPVSDVFRIDTWKHLFDLVFAA
jgi:hypothetical protein